MDKLLQHSSYICINCGSKVENLFRKYSPTVLKLTNCEKCHRVADKYVEYDVIIIIIDLILLQQRAYRHILFNSNYKNLWKLSVIILLIDTYIDWSSYNKYYGFKKIQYDGDYDNFDFYKIGIKNSIRTLVFVITVYLHTILYCKTLKRKVVSFKEVWKILSVSSFGTFFFLPVLIWDIGVHQEIHKFIILVYIILSQLTAYMVIVDGAKIWSIYTILMSYTFKTIIFNYYYDHATSVIMLSDSISLGY
ncbi:protein ARV1 isoform X1 [Coccinella septempunctata]|uniref:protein ARV1 isoform X1 n=1 Tax=Coccinella septempunctata TaxID=41139 RepID=UPI001D0854A6|nr:protein ARV1 isoform X1 [Coccinella septempunctata]XP_044756610.1 protein ARV1 isoform X1 [Coccinella septempunctata]